MSHYATLGPVYIYLAILLEHNSKMTIASGCQDLVKPNSKNIMTGMNKHTVNTEDDIVPVHTYTYVCTGDGV